MSGNDATDSGGIVAFTGPTIAFRCQGKPGRDGDHSRLLRASVMAKMTTTPKEPLPGRLNMAGCQDCAPAMFSNDGGRLHEGHFSVGFDDYHATVTVGGEKTLNIREVIIDRETLLAQVWAYPRPLRLCPCGSRKVLLENWQDVPGVAVAMKAGAWR